MSDRQTFLKDKSYAFVPLIDTCHRTAALSHNDYAAHTYSGKLYLTITVITPLHIGDGHIGVNEQWVLFKRTMRRAGQIIIPGSSIKGVVRSVAEAVSHSCAPKLPDPGLEALQRALPRENRTSCQSADKLCPTCSIFGMANRFAGYRGKVTFGEFAAVGLITTDPEGISLQEKPFKNYPKVHDVFPSNREYGNERLYYCQACPEEARICDVCEKQHYYNMVKKAGSYRPMRFRGRKFYHARLTELNDGTEQNKKAQYEMIKPESTFTGQVIFQNLTGSELSLLAYALGLSQSWQLRLGYGKPKNYGKIKVRLDLVDDLMVRYSAGTGLNKELVDQLAVNYETNASEEVKAAAFALKQILGV